MNYALHLSCSRKKSEYFSWNAYRYFLFSYTSERPSTWGWSISFMIAISRSTFINTDSESFSRLIILIATFLPNTQCTPSFTKPKIKQRDKLCYFMQNVEKSTYRKWGKQFFTRIDGYPFKNFRQKNCILSQPKDILSIYVYCLRESTKSSIYNDAWITRRPFCDSCNSSRRHGVYTHSRCYPKRANTLVLLEWFRIPSAWQNTGGSRFALEISKRIALRAILIPDNSPDTPRYINNSNSSNTSFIRASFDPAFPRRALRCWLRAIVRIITRSNSHV